VLPSRVMMADFTRWFIEASRFASAAPSTEVREGPPVDLDGVLHCSNRVGSKGYKSPATEPDPPRAVEAVGSRGRSSSGRRGSTLRAGRLRRAAEPARTARGQPRRDDEEHARDRRHDEPALGEAAPLSCDQRADRRCVRRCDGSGVGEAFFEHGKRSRTARLSVPPGRASVAPPAGETYQLSGAASGFDSTPAPPPPLLEPPPLPELPPLPWLPLELSPVVTIRAGSTATATTPRVRPLRPGGCSTCRSVGSSPISRASTRDRRPRPSATARSGAASDCRRAARAVVGDCGQRTAGAGVGALARRVGRHLAGRRGLTPA
jgi:hypothetical protein